MEPSLAARIAHELSLPEASVAAVLELLDSGCTVPLIARFRKEKTGGMSELALRAVEERLVYYKELERRRAAAREEIAGQGKLSDDLREKIDKCFAKNELEDLFLPFRPKRRTRAVEARGRGLEPLAEYLWNQETDAWSLEEHADVFIDPEKKITSREEALRGAAEIVAEWISENCEYRKVLRKMMWEEGRVISKVVSSKAEKKTKYNMYYDRSEPVLAIPSHRLLAIRRGCKEGILTSHIECDDAKAMEYLLSAAIRDKESVFAPFIEAAAGYAYAQHLRPALEAEVRTMLKERADREAIRVFQENLANLLLTPPAGPMVVMGLDPGGKSDCKIAVVDAKGSLLEEAVVSPTAPKNDLEGTRAIVKGLIERHQVRAIAVGTGTGSREIELILRTILQEEKLDQLLVVGVNDAGASVYASSKTGREEFPDLDNSTRAAITVARRLQDPLSELVKIDPKTIGVGQYQHDVDQKALHRRLVRTIQSSVNQVGVDLNTAPASLLRHVAGISERMARRIVEHRNANGPFPSREALRSVPGMDERLFTQCAAFLRIAGAENPLDATAVHPESYPVVEKMAESLGVSVGELMGSQQILSTLNLEQFVTDGAGMPTLQDIRDELFKPGRDPRKSFKVASRRTDVRDIGDLKEGMELEGTVTNVTNFGAFVDVGVRQDGLVHLSQLSNRFIRDPREAVQVGQVVKVRVISVETETKRIGLSMKALLPTRTHRRRKPRPRRQTPSRGEAPPAPQQTSDQDSGANDAPADVTAASEPASEEAGYAPARRSPRGRRRGRSPRSLEAQPAPEKEEKAVIPEPSLQEKIAILQSKFRGIS